MLHSSHLTTKLSRGVKTSLIKSAEILIIYQNFEFERLKRKKKKKLQTKMSINPLWFRFGGSKRRDKVNTHVTCEHWQAQYLIQLVLVHIDPNIDEFQSDIFSGM